MKERLSSAWSRRLKTWETLGFEGALRVFYGPGEAPLSEPASNWAVDAYGSYLWITEWEGRGAASASLEAVCEATRQVYEPLGFRGAVVLTRPRQGVPQMPQPLWGEEPPEAFTIVEGPEAHRLRFEIRLREGRHPGLFLDHQPLRDWLARSCGQVRGARVLNTFAYTGSLGIAAWKGGASELTTLDLSKPTIEWARRNGALNDIEPSRSRWFAGDFFEEVPRLARRGERFGVVISDPPSFSRGHRRTFSTQKDLVALHEALLSVLAPGGVLVTSINSANVSVRKFEAEVLEAAARSGRRLERIRVIEQPDSFPHQRQNPASNYLKGFVFEG